MDRNPGESTWLDARRNGAEDAQLQPPEVVIADQIPFTATAPKLMGPLSRGELGVVLVGCQGAADVSLPSDCTPRELRLACRLLAEIVRLRRQRARDRRAHTLLSRLAMTDPLTALENRRAWDDQFATRLQAILEDSGSGCLMLLDLDHFKRVNDQFGHLAGDEVLRRVGRSLKQQAGTVGLAARMGGDEFALLIPGRADADQRAWVEETRLAIQQELVLDETPLLITVSAGFATLTAASLALADRMLATADRALLQAKQAGRNRTVQGT